MARGPSVFLAGACGHRVGDPGMYLLAKRKLAVAAQLGSRALRADAVEAIICGWLSFVVVLGLLPQLAVRAWWIDSVTSLAILWFLVKEGREAWAGVECCDDHGD